MIKRRKIDIMKLMSAGYKVERSLEPDKLYVIFNGPAYSPYSGGVWKVRVELPKEYPFRCPLISFTNKIYHPNVDQVSGSVCRDVIKQAWSPRLDLVYVCEGILPQLLLYPDLNDPLNKDAAVLMMCCDQAAYDDRVRDYCERYAKPEDAGIVPEKPSHAVYDGPVDLQPAPSVTEDKHGSSDKPDALPQWMDPQPAPSSL